MASGALLGDVLTWREASRLKVRPILTRVCVLTAAACASAQAALHDPVEVHFGDLSRLVAELDLEGSCCA